MNLDDAPLGELSAKRFLSRYWQQKPLLIRQAIADFAPPLSADELAGLACEPGIEARIIRGAVDDPSWRLQHGPFADADFAALGDRDWTLLVQAVDHYVPAVAALRRRFRFIPDWRLDDVMVSFAAPGGSVGPHFDQYDVFLLQGEGRREWRIGQHCDEDTALLAHDELRLLEEFTTAQSYVLEPGDMLYLPPGVAHWGVALEPCTTFSIGFRAPSHADIISHFCDDVMQTVATHARFSDPQLPLQHNPGLIDAAVGRQLRDIVAPLLDDNRLLDWFARYMTEPKYGVDSECATLEDNATAAQQPASIARSDAINDLDLTLTTLHLDASSRAAYRVEQGGTILYVDGCRYEGQPGAPSPTPVSDSLASRDAWQWFVETLCAEQQLDPRQHPSWYLHPAVHRTVNSLLHCGALHIAD